MVDIATLCAPGGGLSSSASESFVECIDHGTNVVTPQSDYVGRAAVCMTNFPFTMPYELDFMCSLANVVTWGCGCQNSKGAVSGDISYLGQGSVWYNGADVNLGIRVVVEQGTPEEEAKMGTYGARWVLANAGFAN